MNRALLILMALALGACSGPDEHDTDHAESPRGAHGGRLLVAGDLAVELVIFEAGVEPEFRAWLFEDGAPRSPAGATLTVRTRRLDGAIAEFRLAPEQDYLRAASVVTEPHSFAVTVEARVEGHEPATWNYESIEGRTTLVRETALAMGVAVEKAGPQQLHELLDLSGTVQADPARISRVRARYAGVIRDVAVEPGQSVSRGQLLAHVQSNESLQNYAVTAPIAGILVEHRAQTGEATGEEPLFAIIDVSKVWVELDVFQRELERIAVGQPVALLDLDRKPVAMGRVARIAPLAMHGSQSVRARVAIESASTVLRPGQFVSALVTTSERSVPLAVRREALQRFRDFDVVFERVADTYEVRMLKLGRSDESFVEVLAGLTAGAEYVTKNSYLIKADIEKSGASHDH
jgi:cobalt-zinc-cadmium efflux system membrane fusion protein